MDDINELYSLFPELKAHICVEKKIGQGIYIINICNLIYY